MIHFHKYQGAGNDFIIIDQRTQQYLDADPQTQIARLCDRRFGIGADGLISLEGSETYDFVMHYYNADGGEGSLCGNGGRCVVAFAKKLGIIEEACTFMAVDGIHRAHILPEGKIALQMHDLTEIETINDDYYLHTGSPHYIRMVPDAFAMDTEQAGRQIRYNERFKEEGTNVNFVSSVADSGIKVATYERGVEAETLACGTGVTAAAIVFHKVQNKSQEGAWEIPVQAKGGDLSIRFTVDSDRNFRDVWLIGPATHVFEGQISNLQNRQD